MANNNNNQNGNGNNRDRVPEKKSPEQIAAGLRELGAGLTDGGIIKYGTTAVLAKLAEDDLEAAGLQQVDRVIIKPELRRGDRNTLTGINAAIVFDLSKGGTDVRYMGTDSTGKNMDAFEARQQFLMKSAGIKSPGGDYSTSDIFKMVVGPLAMAYDDNNQILIQKPPAGTGDRFCVVLVDGMELFRMVLGIKEDDPYNFSVTNAERLNGDQYNFTFYVYPDSNSGRKRGKKNRSIDYQRLADSLWG